MRRTAFDESTITAEDQTILIKVGSVKFDTRHEEATIGTITNIIMDRGEVVGLFTVDLEQYPYCEIRDGETMMSLPFRKVGDRTWKLND